MKRLRRSLKVLGGVVGVVAVLELVAVIAWAAGAPTDVVIPIWVGVMVPAAAASQTGQVARPHRASRLRGFGSAQFTYEHSRSPRPNPRTVANVPR